MNLPLVRLLLISIIPTACSISPQQPDSPSSDCAGVAPAAQENCQQQRYKAADAQLNQLYQRLRQQLPAQSANALRDAQRLWLPYRDLHCEHTIAEQQAHLQAGLKAACLARLTQERNSSLQLYQSPQQSADRLDYIKIDQRLNQLYKEQMATISTQQKQHLRQTQRAWLAFRDAECAAQQGIGIAQNSCRADLSEKRNQQLEYPLAANEGAVAVINEQQLLGHWQRLHYNGDLRLHFGVRNGVHYYASQLEQLPHGAGQWQLKQNRLNITDNRGRLLYSYHVLGLDNQVLSLQAVDGSTMHYQKLSPFGARETVTFAFCLRKATSRLVVKP